MRYTKLDVARGLALLGVTGRHLIDSLGHDPAGDAYWAFPLYAWSYYGWTSTTMFFLLSGYLVSHLVFREYSRFGNFELGRFLLRRGLKIYPGFYLLLSMTIITALLCNCWRISTSGLLAECLFLQNYSIGAIAQVWRVPWTWALGVEEQYYLIAGIGVSLLIWKAKDLRAIPLVCVTLIILPPILRVVTFCIRPELDQFTHRFPLHLRCDALAAGVWIAYCSVFHKEQLARIQARKLPLTLSALILCFLAVIQPFPSAYGYCFGLTLILSGFSLLLIRLLSASPDVGKIQQIFISLAAFSYAIYLWHIPIAAVVRKLSRAAGVDSPPVLFLAELSGAIAFGVIMTKLFEQPILRWRDKVIPSRSKSPVTGKRNSVELQPESLGQRPARLTEFP